MELWRRGAPRPPPDARRDGVRREDLGATIARRAAILLTSRLPWPLDDGGRIATWQIVWAAAQAYDVTLLCFVPPGEASLPIPRALLDLGIQVERVARRPPPLPVAIAAGLLGRWPYTLARYQSAAMAERLTERVRALAPAYVMAAPLHMAPYVEALEGTPMVLRQHNVEHLWMARYARQRGATPAGLYARVQALRLEAVEAALCRRVALTLAIQREETESLRALAPDARIETLPVGIDLDRYPAPAPAEPPVVLLAGSFAWRPNVDGAIRFLREGWPSLRASSPGVRLRLAGRCSSAALAETARAAGADLALDVPSMPEEFARATILLVPLWVGAGARVKIIEALAARLPVVATPTATEGLDLEPGIHCLHGGTPAELAARAADLLARPSRRAELAEAGRAAAETRWSLPTVARLQNELVAQIAHGSPRAADPGRG